MYMHIHYYIRDDGFTGTGYILYYYTIIVTVPAVVEENIKRESDDYSVFLSFHRHRSSFYLHPVFVRFGPRTLKSSLHMDDRFKLIGCHDMTQYIHRVTFRLISHIIYMCVHMYLYVLMNRSGRVDGLTR